MPLDERIPIMSGAELEILRSNAVRLVESGTPRQALEAERVLPLIDAELSQRRAKAAPPAKAARAATKATTVKRKPPAKKKTAKPEDA